ncbi:MAG: hypothetical protein ACD_60C00015G0023 [uncultured bacterium]|nr:MAG: hypothetical protein ACD_60C00015G0023 [uncultured bacterium]
MKLKINSILLTLSITLYLLALYFPALGCNYFGADSARYTISTGFIILISGWLGIFVLNFAWLANVTYFITLFLIFKKRSKILFFASANLILGMSSLFLYFDKTQEVGLYLGFYLWIGSFILLIMDAVIKNDTLKHQNKNK